MEKDEFFYDMLSENIAFTDLKLHLDFLKEQKYKKRKKIIDDVLNEKLNEVSDSMLPND